MAPALRAAVRAAGWLGALLLGLTAGWWVAPPAAYACSCAYSADDPRLRQLATVIFTGTIVEDTTRWSTRTLVFAVDRVYKGEAYARQVVRTDAEPASCGLEIAGPGTFLVLARSTSPGGSLRADLCGGTRAGPAPAELGAGTPPLPAPPDRAVPQLVGGGVLVAAVAVGLLWRRRRSASP